MKSRVVKHAKSANSRPAPSVAARSSQVEAPRRRESAAHEAENVAGLHGGESSQAAAARSLVSAPGRPLDPSTREFMRSRFGSDFGDVRIHDHGQAAEAARLLRANAFTLGTDVGFAAGRYEPHSFAGRRLLAHELAHVVQQRGEPAGEPRGEPLEAAADAAADAVAVGRPAAAQPRAPTAVACQPNTAPDPAPAVDDRNTKLTQSDVLFKPLPPGHGWLTGTGRNTMAQHLHDEFERVFEVSQDAQSAMGFLYWTENTLGPRNLDRVTAIAPLVAKKSVGDAGEKMRKAVEDYTQAFPELESTLSELQSAEADVVGKSETFLKAVTDQKATAAKRAEKKAETDVKEVKERIENAKKWVDEIIDGTFKVFEGEWQDALKDVGKFALKELVAGPAVELVYQADLEKAQQALTDARRLVDSLEDESDLHAINSAAKELEAARKHFSSVTSHLVAVGRRANSAHRTLIEKISRLGKAGARAAEALESREEVAEEAERAAELLGTYESLVEKAGKDAHSLTVSYQLYVEFARSPGGENEVPNQELRLQLAQTAEENEWTSYHLESWCTDELGRVAEARRYIESEAYMEPYRKIDAVLATAVANR